MDSPIYGKLQNSDEQYINKTELSKWRDIPYLCDIINTLFLSHLSYRFMHTTKKYREIFCELAN